MVVPSHETIFSQTSSLGEKFFHSNSSGDFEERDTIRVFEFRFVRVQFILGCTGAKIRTDFLRTGTDNLSRVTVRRGRWNDEHTNFHEILPAVKTTLSPFTRYNTNGVYT